MITIALTLLRKYWKVLLVIIAILAVVLYMRGLYSTIDDQSQQITNLTTANKTLTDNNIKLEATITASNKAIEQMSKNAEKTTNAFANLDKSVRAQTGNLEDRLRRIMQDKKPQTCEDTILYLIEAAKEMSK